MIISARKSKALNFCLLLIFILCSSGLIGTLAIPIDPNKPEVADRLIIFVFIVNLVGFIICICCIGIFSSSYELPNAEDVLKKHTIYRQFRITDGRSQNEYIGFKNVYIMNVYPVWPESNESEKIVVFREKMPSIFYVSDTEGPEIIRKFVWREVSPEELEKLVKAKNEVTELYPVKFE